MGIAHPPKAVADRIPLDGRVAGHLVGHTLAEVEQVLIIRTLSETEWNRTRAANTLGISVRCLRNKIHQFKRQGIPIPEAGRSRRDPGGFDVRAWTQSRG